MMFAATAAYDLTDDELAQLLDYHRDHAPVFARSEVRHTRLKRHRLDCGHGVDGGEPYRYQVWKLRGTAGVEQRRDCEFCARVDEGRAR